MTLRKWLGLAGLFAVLAMALISLPNDGSNVALADEDPAGCAAEPARSGASLQVYFDNAPNDGVPDGPVGSQPVVQGDKLLYEAGVNIGAQLPASCTAFDIHTWVLLPGAASYVKACEIAVLAAGQEIFCTSAGATPEATFPTGYVPYTVNIAHINGAGRLPADTTSRGDVHDSPGDCLLTDAEKNANNADPGACFRASTSRSLAYANPILAISKACTSQPVVVGQDVTFNVTLTNNSASTTGVRVEINSITVTDSLTGTLAPPGPYTLAQSGDSTTPVFTHTTVPPAGTVENTASATSTAVTLYAVGGGVLRVLPGVSAGPVNSDPDCLTVSPSISIVKTINNDADGVVTEIQPGDQVTFKYRVCNTGDVSLSNVTVTDDNGTPGVPGDDFVVNVPGPIAATNPDTCVDVDSGLITIPNPPICDETRLNIGLASGTGAGTVVTDTDDAELCRPPVPSISIVKTINNDADGAISQIQPGDLVTFKYRVCNTGETSLSNVVVTDDNATPGVPGDDFTVNVPGPIPATNPDTCVDVASNPIAIPNPPVCGATRLNIGLVSGTAPDGTVVTDTDNAELCTPPGGGEGCTPGFWKNHTNTTKYPNAWPPTGYTPNMKVADAFQLASVGLTMPTGYANITLIQALNSGGGQFNALLRHAVASLLNSAHGDIDFDITQAEVIALFQDAVDAGNGDPGSSAYEPFKNIFAMNNEDGCPISGK